MVFMANTDPIPYDFSSTPTALPPAPRPVRGKFGYLAGQWVVRLFLLPFMLAGMIAPGFLALNLMCMVAGHEVQGTVISKEARSGDSESGPTLHLKYSYFIGDKVQTGTQQVTEA